MRKKKNIRFSTLVHMCNVPDELRSELKRIITEECTVPSVKVNRVNVTMYEDEYPGYRMLLLTLVSNSMLNIDYGKVADLQLLRDVKFYLRNCKLDI